MDFEFNAPVNDMSAPNHQQNMVSMHNLLNNPIPSTSVQWRSPAQPTELPSIPHDLRQFPPQPMHPSEIHQDHHRQHMQAPDMKPIVAQPSPTFQLDDNPPIEQDVVNQMGGLPYADLCKERARERFKEMKKNEHMAKGEFDRMKRRKKGDTSMTPREKYVRRLKMNQDSAAAARHAQEVYVHVLEKLVRTTEAEKKAMMAENQALKHEVARLRTEREESQLDPQTLIDYPERLKKCDPNYLAKMLDILSTPEPVSAQANDPEFAAGKMGIQPAPAV
eukprot:GFKZ01009657.1.p1 GENE.GFKZ01009657.1~~GFKZ01009657.1.p1  ORF type:complete len:277 (-),score=50.41 GFKZ01009657.1:2999-3829(-)